jgi:formylglycine-generating enzyme required for sulfatase activity
MLTRTALATLVLLALPAAAAEPDPAGAASAAPAAQAEPAGVQTAVAAAHPDAAVAGTAAPATPTPRAAGARPAMVELPGGSFWLGERIGPVSDLSAFVHVKPFLLDANEVTVAEYSACVKARRCRPAHPTIEWEGVKKADRTKWSERCNRDREDRAEHPVNCVDWNQARDYCAWAGKRLPTSAEWEWAARNGEKGTAYPWGDDPPGERPCWSGAKGEKGELRDGTCPVGSNPAADTASGVKDLAGNVWEWTATDTVILPDSRGRDGAPARISRGGGWADRVPGDLAAQRRAKNMEGWRGADLGFRCARSR